MCVSECNGSHLNVLEGVAPVCADPREDAAGVLEGAALLVQLGEGDPEGGGKAVDGLGGVHGLAAFL